MREFANLQQEPSLVKYSDHPLGTLYMVLDQRGLPETMVRHFDRDLPPQLARPYADLVRATGEWIKDHSGLARWVEVVQPVEVGSDFVTRPFHVQHTSLKSYVEGEDPPESPEELEEMRVLLRAAIQELVDERQAIIQRVLTRSLLEPTYDTYFNERVNKFFVVEPALTRDDIERWDATNPVATN